MTSRSVFVSLALASWLTTLQHAAAQRSAYLRVTLVEPAGRSYWVQLAGYIHRSPWYLPRRVVPEEAARDPARRLPSGTPTPWINLVQWAGDRLHGRLARAGGRAEYPNVTVQIHVEPPASRLRLIIELATAPDPDLVVRRWEERIEGGLTSVLVSPYLERDAAELETATEMTNRRLRWAILASRGRRHSPRQLILQTNLWGPQRPELNLREARVLWLLGFNTVGNQPREVRLRYPEFRVPAHRHGVPLGPGADREQIRRFWHRVARSYRKPLPPGTTFGINDEVVCRPPIGDNAAALAAFRRWLAEQGISPAELGVRRLDDVVPIETPDQLRERMKQDERAARRVFYWTSRFRQAAATQRLKWNTEEIHRQLGPQVIATTLVADHPYFAGTGLGMGMHRPNTAWGGWPLAMDWFSIGRQRAVDLIGIEDWLGLQYMYGPNYTWEGFQLLGFQAAIFRSASRGRLPIIVWVTPSDDVNLQLKFASAFAQGASHLFFWTYGPTATSTENYWSDLRSAYDGIVRVARMMALLEPALASGRPRPTRVALLYSIASDLWQPYDYVHMLERRGLYLALVHDHWQVDLLSEEDVEAGALQRYDVLFTADPCVKSAAAERIRRWVADGGLLVGTCTAGSRNEYDEPTGPLHDVFGIGRIRRVTVQRAPYRVRAGLNRVAPFDTVATDHGTLEAVGLHAEVVPASDAVVVARYQRGGGAAILENRYGKGRAVYYTFTPGISYIREARFVAGALAERWPPSYRRMFGSLAERAGAQRLARVSEPVVEVGVRDGDDATAIILGNFTYEPIRTLRIAVAVPHRPIAVVSATHGPLAFRCRQTTQHAAGLPYLVEFAVPLDVADGILLKYGDRTGR